MAPAARAPVVVLLLKAGRCGGFAERFGGKLFRDLFMTHAMRDASS
jgi:hypothetical protein